MSRQPYEKVKDSRKDLIINNFLGGIAWALGATIGFSLLITLLGFIAAQVGVVPIVGTFVSNIIDFVLNHNPNLQK